MPKIVKHSVETKQGEVNVNINLTLELKFDGNKMTMTTKNSDSITSEKEDTIILPDIEDFDQSELIDFGKEG